jgi:hypothetical protein
MLVQRQGLDRGWEEREESAKVRLPEAEALKVRAAHVAPGEGAPEGCGVVEERVDRSIRKAGCDRRKRPFGTPAHEQVVVDERD